MRRVLMMGSILAVLAASVTLAQSPPSVSVSAAISWVAPVNDANHLPLAGSPNAVTSYNVYGSTTPLTAVPSGAPLAVVSAPSTTVTGSISAHVGDTLYVYVTACDTTGCSGLSDAGTKVVTTPSAAPGVPTKVTITLTVLPSS
ncbi:MAG TPA: hypothetical protein VI653_28450 [Steroidobacteraceae bacterium]